MVLLAVILVIWGRDRQGAPPLAGSDRAPVRVAEPSPMASTGTHPPQVTILSPIDPGTLQASPQESPPHHTFGGEWAADLAGHGAVHARFSSLSGDVVLTLLAEYDPCGVPNSGGLGVTIGVDLNGTRIGTVEYLHLASVEVPPGVIANGSKLGDMITNPPARSRCWGNEHVHVEPRSEAGHSCFLPRHLHTDLDASSSLGILSGALGPSGVCPTGSLDAVSRVGDVVRLTGWARHAHLPNEVVRVQALVDRRLAGEWPAEGERADVGPHGFSFTVPADGRPHVVCATARGLSGTPDVPLTGCHQV